MTKCDNCNKFLPVKIITGDIIKIIPIYHTTNFHGKLCCTSCCVNYIHKNIKAIVIQKFFLQFTSS
jgi:hypothetical protein